MSLANLPTLFALVKVACKKQQRSYGFLSIETTPFGSHLMSFGFQKDRSLCSAAVPVGQLNFPWALKSQPVAILLGMGDLPPLIGNPCNGAL